MSDSDNLRLAPTMSPSIKAENPTGKYGHNRFVWLWSSEVGSNRLFWDGRLIIVEWDLDGLKHLQI